MLTTVANFELITRDLDRTLKTTANEPVVARESEYYLANITKVKSIDDFLGDDRLFRFAMKAHGLGDMAYAKAFMRKALEGGVDDPESFANSLVDKRYRDFVEVFNFVRYGDTAIAFDRTQQGTVDRYVRQSLEESVGNTNEAVRLALYFERKAADINSPYDILADRALTQVVQTALGIPAMSSQQNIDRQAETILAKLDLEDFQDPAKVRDFTRRFAALWDTSNPTTSTPVPSIVIGGAIEFGISATLLSQLQGLKPGGR